MYGGKKEHYFALLYLTRKFKAEPEELGHQVAFENSDSGVHAYYVDRRAGNLYLYHFNWSESHTSFKEPMERVLKVGLPSIFGTPLDEPLPLSLHRHLAQDL